ncbi:eukaryotic initiation factor 4E binding [Dimargaris cristalligena]|uniref:Eukaryotic translation initiation factor 4E binding protein-domain-containing protein n=1 Tax=Dimargaris cristalligena TaxID=215637 RepID=A0A4P9ZVM2_9FUNG|nr:eukaryotic initiation factor 4E binding [Dimargaris cristalligena]RKP37328.1 eukaryotic translation initiation factor 4E binding protein-domain-containing protein [Dimargaris cristalligena]RKP37331.1 eukaryotic translation initiation factor 4E binding protein-domain-containing protein [Dimargaris cristalligena]|eukprot:RKP37328.1 eukaryotic translation initiation factor 4E binding protein-domain-containing protein [Dimargaris cristalligena]
MTASTTTPTSARHIPTRRARPDEQIPEDYGTTPGGTIFSTTPRGTRIVYGRQQLLALSNSPLSQTPPSRMNVIPGVTGSSAGTYRAPHLGTQQSTRPVHSSNLRSGGGSSNSNNNNQHQPQSYSTSTGNGGKLSSSIGGNQQPGFRAPPNTPANKLALPQLNGDNHLLNSAEPLPKLMTMSLEEQAEEDEELDPPVTANADADKDKHPGVFELEM